MEVHVFCKNCVVCQQSKLSNPTPAQWRIQDFSEGGCLRSGPIRKVGGGGGGGGQSASGPIPFWHTENTVSLIINGYNFGRGGGGGAQAP